MRAGAQSLLSAIENIQEQAARYKAAREAYEKGAAAADSQPPRLLRRGDADASSAQARQDGKTDDERAAEAFSSALNDALRKPLAGETRGRGVLTRIECTARGQLVFVVRLGDRTLRLSAKTFEEVHIMAFTPEAGSQLTCGPRKPESQVVVTYRAGPDARAKTDGALAALEFVPDNFQLKQ